MAAEAAAVEEARPHHDRLHLDRGPERDDSLGALLPASAAEQGLGHHDVHRSVAAGPGRLALLLGRQRVRLLPGADAVDIAVLHPHLDQSLEALDPRRLEGRADGPDAAEVQDESGQNADRCCDFVRLVLAAALFDLCPHQVR